MSRGLRVSGHEFLIRGWSALGPLHALEVCNRYPCTPCINTQAIQNIPAILQQYCNIAGMLQCCWNTLCCLGIVVFRLRRWESVRTRYLCGGIILQLKKFSRTFLGDRRCTAIKSGKCWVWDSNATLAFCLRSTESASRLVDVNNGKWKSIAKEDKDGLVVGSYDACVSSLGKKKKTLHYFHFIKYDPFFLCWRKCTY